jgi:hypothetical protein
MLTVFSCRRREAVWFYAALLAAGIGAGAAVSAQEPSPPAFSAQIISRNAAGVRIDKAAKIYVADRMVRIESSATPDGFFLIDAAKGTASFVLPGRGVFMDAKRSSFLTQVFVPIDADDPCRQWRAAAELADAIRTDQWRCERTAKKAADGGHAIGYRVASTQGGSDLRWVDSALMFPVMRSAADGNTLTLENLRIESQTADLFIIPSDFRRLDPQALIERIKHSDVWVDP